MELRIMSFIVSGNTTASLKVVLGIPNCSEMVALGSMGIESKI